jgi:hypothetical protein
MGPDLALAPGPLNVLLVLSEAGFQCGVLMLHGTLYRSLGDVRPGEAGVEPALGGHPALPRIQTPAGPPIAILISSPLPRKSQAWRFWNV